MTAEILSMISQLLVENNPRPPTAQLMKPTLTHDWGCGYVRLFMSIVDVKKSQSSQPPHGSRLTVHKTVAHSQLQSLEPPVFIIVLKASLDGEHSKPVVLCCMESCLSATLHHLDK